ELEREAGALRKTEEHHAVVRHAFRVQLVDERAEDAERGCQVRLVLFDRRQKRLRIPRAAGSIRRHVRQIVQARWIGGAADVARRRAGAVPDNPGQPGGFGFRTWSDDRHSAVLSHREISRRLWVDEVGAPFETAFVSCKMSPWLTANASSAVP